MSRLFFFVCENAKTAELFAGVLGDERDVVGDRVVFG